MLIKYCNNCNDNPYTTKVEMTVCPICSSTLRIESADEESLRNRPTLPDSPERRFEDSHFNFTPVATPTNKEKEGLYVPPAKGNGTIVKSFEKDKNSYVEIKTNSETICGKVSQYSSTGKEDGEYRRLLPVKIYQALVYRQRLEDVLHRFTVRVEHGKDALGYQQYTDIPVNVHGTISGGLQLTDNSVVEVHGKYNKDGVLMADSICVINNGHESKIGFQRSVKAITYGILTAVMLLFVCFVAATSNGNFLANIKEFCTVWLVMAIILTVLYLITSLTKIGLLTRMFSNKKQSFPIFGILLISLALAFLFVSAFGSFTGFGSFLSGWIYSLIPIIIIIVAIFFVIKSLF